MRGETARRIREFMLAAGFRLVRSAGRHHVWSDGCHTVTTSASPSCHRAFKNARAVVRRLRRKTAAEGAA